MPRIHRVQSARAVPIPRKCGICGTEINKGDSFLWYQKYRSSKSFRCLKTQVLSKGLTADLQWPPSHDIRSPGGPYG